MRTPQDRREDGALTAFQSSIGFGGVVSLDRKMFFDDSDVNEHPDATSEDCANEVKRYIAEEGLTRFLRDWNVEQDIVIYVDDERVYP